MARDIIRVTVAVRVSEDQSASQVAQEFRDARVGAKLQSYLSNIAGPSVVKGVELEDIDSEHLTHQCDWYEVDECDICRFASSYSLSRTEGRHF